VAAVVSTVLVGVRRVLVVLALVAVLLRFGYGEESHQRAIADVEVLLVVDLTHSMSAYDQVEGLPRITAVQADLLALVQAMPQTRIGLLTFRDEVRLEIPFTTDYERLRQEIQRLEVEDPYAGQGSRADKPLAGIVEVLRRADAAHPERRQLVVYVGDGENTLPGEQDSFAQADPYADGGVVLGYGTEKGAPMPVAEDLTRSRGLLVDPRTGTEAVSRADLANLRRIARQLDAPFVHRTRPGGMDRVAESLEPDYVADENQVVSAERDLTWLFGLLLLGLVLLELRWAWRTLWTSRRALGRAEEGAR
jgi:Ca-activated chloride channel family protein